MHNCKWAVPHPYLTRSLEPVLSRAVAQFPAVVLTGPRQSGKTTLLKHLFGRYRYVSLEPPDVRAAADIDPRGFLETYAPPVIFDEIQYAAGLLPYIKERIDGNRSARGQYLLTGSQNLLRMGRVTESLAGRVATLRLLPLSGREAAGDPSAQFAWENGVAGSRVRMSGPSLWQSFLRGGYLELVAEPDRDIALWHSS